MNHPYDFDDIDDYVHGRMSNADLKAFEEALAQDTDLAEQVEAVRAEGDILAYLRKEALMEEFGKWEESPSRSITEGNTKEKPSASKKYWVWGILTAIVGVAIWLLFFKNDDSSLQRTPESEKAPITLPQDTVLKQEGQPVAGQDQAEKKIIEPPSDQDQHPQKKPNVNYLAMSDLEFEPLEDLYSGSIRADGTDTTLFEQALKLYQNKQFNQVIQLDRQNAPANYVYLKALSFYKLKQYKKAVGEFSSITPDLILGYDAEWGEVISILAQMPASCKDLAAKLKPIRENLDHPFYQKANGLIDAISLNAPCKLR